MKKTIKSLLALAVAAFAFTACSDIPEPEGYNSDQGDGKEVFEPTGDGGQTTPWNVAGILKASENWDIAGPYPKAVYTKGYIKEFNTTGSAAFNPQYGNLSFYITDSKTGNSEPFYAFHCKGLGNKSFTSASDLKVGDEVVIIGDISTYNGQYQYGSNVYLYSLNGKTEGGGEPTGENILVNGDFETWADGVPTHWKTSGSAGNATLTQSTDARNGSYSVSVGFDALNNKRMGYEETTLKAGTYTFSFYAKSTTTDASQTQAGFVDIATNKYTYGGYVNLKNTEWTLVSTKFTLSADTKVSLVMMNPKTSSYATAQNILVDDATLVTADGGIVDGGGESGGGDQPGNSYFEESFASGKGSFTISDKVYTGVWNAATYQSDNFMKATSYVEKANHDAESWLISPEFDIAAATNPTLSFAQAINGYFGTIADEAMVYAKKDGGDWTKLSISYPEKPSKGFTQFVAQTVSLANFKSSKTQIAFVYKGTATASGTWEVKDVKVREAE